MAIRRRTAKAVPTHGQSTETRCIGGMCDPQRIQGLKAPAPKGTYNLINLTGPGLFLAGHVTKQGGATGLTFVRLQIDGRSVVDLSFAGARTGDLRNRIRMDCRPGKRRVADFHVRLAGSPRVQEKTRSLCGRERSWGCPIVANVSAEASPSLRCPCESDPEAVFRRRWRGAILF